MCTTDRHTSKPPSTPMKLDARSINHTRDNKRSVLIERRNASITRSTLRNEGIPIYRLFFSLTEPRISSRSGNPLKVIPFDIVGGLSVKIIDVETFPIITPLSIVDQSLDNVLSPRRASGVAFRRVSTTS